MAAQRVGLAAADQLYQQCLRRLHRRRAPRHPLAFDEHGIATNFQQQVADPIRWFCTQNVDIPATVLGLFGAVPLVPSGSHYLANALKNLYGNISMSMLPAPDKAPEFLIDATNL